MAVDRSFERTLAERFHRDLDAAVGPHPQWAGSPAALKIQDEPRAAVTPRRRVSWATVLLAAAVAAALIGTGLLIAGGLQQRSLPGPSASPAAVVPALSPSPATPTPQASTSPSAGPSATPLAVACQTSWTHTGTTSPVGLVDGIRVDAFDGAGGELVFVFGHPLDTVKRIQIEPAEPPFRTSTGTRVNVAGSVFFLLTIEGLTKPTPVDDRMVPGKHTPPYLPTVGLPIAEMRRLTKPAYGSPNAGPGRKSTEVWVIGMTGPSCIRVRTARESYTDELGDNALVVAFDHSKMLVPEPILLPSPSASR